MTTKQRLELRMSKIRGRLREIAGMKPEDVTEEVRSEADQLETEYGTVDTQYRAAIVSESQEEAAAIGLYPDGSEDGETAELRALLQSVSLADYLGPAVAGVGLSGAAAELADGLGIPKTGKSGGIPVPWRILLSDALAKPEDRAFTTTTQYGGPVGQRPILQRLFGLDIMDVLGVRIDTVPVGRTEWPLITAGTSIDMKTEGTAADTPVAATFAKETLKPKRLTGAFEYSHEMAASVEDIEQALRRDLADAVKSQMNQLIITGDEATNPQEPDGFATTITAPDNASATATYADYAGSHALGVDGVHASMETEVSSVIGVDVYKHAASVYQAGSGESGSEALSRRGMKCMASPFVGTAANSGQHKLNLYHASGPNGGSMRGDSVAAIWPTLEIIRDIYSKASQGVILTWVTLWDAQTAFRSSAYQRVAFKIT